MHKWRVCSQHIFLVWILVWVGLLRWLSSEESTCNAGETRDAGSVPGSGRSSGGGNGNPLQYSCLATPRDRGAWQATVHGVTKSWTRLSDTHTHTHTLSTVLSALLQQTIDYHGMQWPGNKAMLSSESNQEIWTTEVDILVFRKLLS